MSWDTFQKFYLPFESLGFAADFSRVGFTDEFFARLRAPMSAAFDAMDALERGAIANPDEKRMVGHYWLRNPALAPTPEITREIETTIQSIEAFTAKTRRGQVEDIFH
jgi:glucose-6-phosphate isomerase